MVPLRSIYDRLVQTLTGSGVSPRIEDSRVNAWLRQQQSANLQKFAIIAFQLGLLTLVIAQFEVENPAFYTYIAPLILVGFLVHHFLPQQYRLWFFLLLSLAGIGIVFGWMNGVWLVCSGLVLIGICHLPISLAKRAVLLLLAGIVLALLRIDFIRAPWSGEIWPVLGAMFMFRLIIYLYDLRHEKGPPSFPRTLSYFFLLPNVIFPLFPVVDYSTFRRTYYDDEEYRIYQRGIDWIVRGVIQLILYRVVYYHLTLSPSEVLNVNDLMRFLVANFLLYLRVSGDFHLIVGILLLFGFNLPETNQRYMLASSFTDFWRRINIYWKDFMLKIIYYPVYFRLRKKGIILPLVISTIAVFVVTWFLHGYQAFWLLGYWSFSLQDMLFWAILAVLLVAGSIYALNRPKKKPSLGHQTWTVRELAFQSLRTVGVFIIICVLWSLWSSASVSDWVALWSILGTASLNDYFSIMGWIVIGVMIAALFIFLESKSLARESKGGRPSNWRSALPTIVLLVLTILTFRNAVYSQLGPQIEVVVDQLRSEGLNRQDGTLMMRGYYENLMGVNHSISRLWQADPRQASVPALLQAGAARLTNDLLFQELLPSVSVNFLGKPFGTNRWGMRDQDYEQKKSERAYRIALLGASLEMGWGVGDKESFESRLEERLNRAESEKAQVRYELLNFAVGGYTPLQNLIVLQDKALSFQPDALILFVHPGDRQLSVTRIKSSVSEGNDLRFDYLKQLVAQTRITSETSTDEMERRLGPHSSEIISWAYQQIAQTCRERGIIPIWVYVPLVGPNADREYVPSYMRAAEAAGFVALDFSDIYSDQDASSMMIATYDFHPNAEGHQIIADRLYEALHERNLVPSRVP